MVGAAKFRPIKGQKLKQFLSDTDKIEKPSKELKVQHLFVLYMIELHLCANLGVVL